jgi:hypothetical protein
MQTYSVAVISQDDRWMVTRMGHHAPDDTLHMCVNQGTTEGLDGMYVYGLSSGTYSRAFSGRLAQAARRDSAGAYYIMVASEPYELIRAELGPSPSQLSLASPEVLAWDLALDEAAQEVRYTERHLVRSVPMAGGTAVTVATFSEWLREIAVDQATGDIWLHSQDPAQHYVVRLDAAQGWSASTVFATTSYIGSVEWSATHSSLWLTCGLNSAGIYALSGPTATPLPLDPGWPATYSAWKALAISQDGRPYLASLVFGTGETASYIVGLSAS